MNSFTHLKNNILLRSKVAFIMQIKYLFKQMSLF